MKFYKSLKSKAIAGTLLLAAILCAAFIRIVPDYSISRGFALVTIFGYNKYKQGYCLAENRILDKEELYKRAIKEHLNKKMEIWKGVRTKQKLEYDYNIDIKKSRKYWLLYK